MGSMTATTCTEVAAAISASVLQGSAQSSRASLSSLQFPWLRAIPWHLKDEISENNANVKSTRPSLCAWGSPDSVCPEITTLLGSLWWLYSMLGWHWRGQGCASHGDGVTNGSDWWDPTSHATISPTTNQFYLRTWIVTVSLCHVRKCEPPIMKVDIYMNKSQEACSQIQSVWKGIRRKNVRIVTPLPNMFQFGVRSPWNKQGAKTRWPSSAYHVAALQLV